MYSEELEEIVEAKAREAFSGENTVLRSVKVVHAGGNNYCGIVVGYDYDEGEECTYKMDLLYDGRKCILLDAKRM